MDVSAGNPASAEHSWSAGQCRYGGSMSEFLAMGGYAFYVWGAYGVAALVVAGEIASVRAKRRAVLAETRVAGAAEAAR